LHEKFLADEAKLYVPVCTAEVNKPHGTPYTLGEDIVAVTNTKGDKQFLTSAKLDEKLSVTEAALPHLPTTGREAPSYLASENENVTTVIPAVKKKRTKKTI